MSKYRDELDCFEHDWTPWRTRLQKDGEDWNRHWAYEEYRECRECFKYQVRHG